MTVPESRAIVQRIHAAVPPRKLSRSDVLDRLPATFEPIAGGTHIVGAHRRLLCGILWRQALHVSVLPHPRWDRAGAGLETGG